MDVEFANDDLKRLEKDSTADSGFAPGIGRRFRKVMRLIRSAVDERDFRALRSLNFEKLKGNRSHQHSFRLNKQWRLIVEIKKSKPKNTIRACSIEDYH